MGIGQTEALRITPRASVGLIGISPQGDATRGLAARVGCIHPTEAGQPRKPTVPGFVIVGHPRRSGEPRSNSAGKRPGHPHLRGETVGLLVGLLFYNGCVGRRGLAGGDLLQAGGVAPCRGCAFCRCAFCRSWFLGSCCRFAAWRDPGGRVSAFGSPNRFCRRVRSLLQNPLGRFPKRGDYCEESAGFSACCGFVRRAFCLW